MKKIRLRYAARDQVEIQVMSLDQMLPAEHLAREIWAYVEKMDLNGLQDEVGSLEGRPGAPAFDRRTLMCLWLYATADSVGSARRLSRLVGESLPYRWIAGGAAVNYHTLSDFRSRHGEALDRLLTASMAVLAAEGWVELENMTVAHDGMRVRASAGRGSMHRRATLERTLETAKAHVSRLKERCRRPDDNDDPPGAGKRAARERAARERVERLNHALEVMEKMEGKQRVRTDRKPREPRVSSTDPEAAMLHMANGGKDPAHNLQFTTEVATRAITSVAVADMSSDTGMLLPAMENYKRAYGRLPVRVLADRGFFKYSDIEALEEGGCEVLLPDLYPTAQHVGKASGAPIDRWRRRMKTDAAKEQYKLRPSTVEWSNARVRQQGLLQLTVRGSVKVLAVGLWHALTHNILRTLALRKAALARAG